MRSLCVAALFCAAASAQAQDSPPTIRSALEAADAATAANIPVVSLLNEREAILHELEFRTGKFQSARRQMQQALNDMAADPKVDPKLHQAACQAAAPALRAPPDLVKRLRGKVEYLERPANYQQLTPSQVESLARLKISVDVLSVQPDITCSRS